MRIASAVAAACLGLLVMILALDVNLMSLTNLIGIQVLKGCAWAVNLRASASSSSEIHASPVSCDRSHATYDLCTVDGPALLDPATATISSLDRTSPPRAPVKIRPYTRKRDRSALSGVREVTIASSPPPNATCGATQAAPALVFSAGGYTGNFFHEFSDGLVPLFITVESIFPDRDVTLAVVDCRDWWLRRYADVLSHFSRRPVINLDRQKETLCFPSITVGLIKHGPMTIDPKLLPHPKSLRDFASFLDGVYGGGGGAAAPLPSAAAGGRPRLVLVSRPRSAGRAFLNLGELEALAERIGFEVRRFAPNRGTRLAESCRLVRGSHAMAGVHGAAMTHAVFLRPGAVLLQVVPVGTTWLSEAYFGRPAREMGLEYVEYRIGANESSLAEEYGADSVVLRDPRAVVGGEWKNMRLYLKTQNVRLDLGRFRASLERAYVKAKAFMETGESS